ncbi:MAG: heterodisulfide reductase-related iron-sulfur binding cluster [Candidatus Hodarchaeota archaeon]
MTKRLAFFLGCALPSAHLFAEASTRLSMENLGVEIVDLEGATCCPDPEISRTLGPELWIRMAARNLALAEAAEADMFTVCNGCWETLSDAKEMLAEDQKLREEIGQDLEKLGLRYTGKYSLYHAIEVFHDVVGIEKIKSSIKRTFNGTKMALQPGCRIYKRSEKELPKKMQELVEILGCEVVELQFDRLCCGVPLMYTDAEYSLIERTKVKLDEIRSKSLQGIVTFCPACYDRIEKGQLELNMREENYNIPVFSYSELLAFALGHEPDDFGAYLHKLDYSRVFSM